MTAKSSTAGTAKRATGKGRATTHTRKAQPTSTRGRQVRRISYNGKGQVFLEPLSKKEDK